MTRVFVLRICQFVGFAIPSCIQCICYQTRAKLSKDRNVKVLFFFLNPKEFIRISVL